MSGIGVSALACAPLRLDAPSAALQRDPEALALAWQISGGQPELRPEVYFALMQANAPYAHMMDPRVWAAASRLSAHLCAPQTSGAPIGGVDISIGPALPPVEGLPTAKQQEREFIAKVGGQVYGPEAIRNAHLANTGQVATAEDVRYPEDIPMPDEVRNLNLRLPFPPGIQVHCTQGNNSMFALEHEGRIHGGTHSPKQQDWIGNLRYSLDFAVPGRTTGAPILAAAGVARTRLMAPRLALIITAASETW